MRHAANMADKWESDLRAAIRGTCGKGWTARKGGVDTTQLIYRAPEPFERAFRTGTVKKTPQQTGTIQLAWHINNVPQILAAAQASARMVGKGTHLHQAARLACGPTPLGPLTDWDALVDRFGEHRTKYTGELSPRTWSRMHLPSFRLWVELLSGPDAPTTAGEAFRKLPLGEPGSRGRQQRVATISRFLTWCVTTGLLGPEWSPPSAEDKKTLIGKAPKTDRTQITGVLSDQEIQEILDNTHHGHWWWILTAMALYGLRPEEVVHLRFRDDKLWSMFRKRTSRGMTEPRRIYALEPFTGLEDRWLGLWGMKLPDLGRNKGRVACSITIYLNRQKVWTELKADADRKIVPYSFRHAYALRAARQGIPPRMAAAAMGHTLGVHLSSYSKFMDNESMDAVFARAQQ